MQTTFLSNVIQAVKGYNLQKTIVVFPTRRACINFKEELAKDLNSISWLPIILPVRDLLIQLSPLPVADENTLLMELFKVYEKLYPNDDIESFLSWGQQLIDDFNEIDRQMVPADQLFQKVLDVKNIENIFSLEEDDFAYFKEFWSQFSSENITPLRHEFLSYWEMLPSLYKEYKRHLLNSEISYEGMSWEMAASNISNNTFFDSFEKVVFAGFYAFTKSEEKIIKHLEVQGKVILFKDADSWYVEAKYREAGRFFRKGILSNAEIPWTNTFLTTSTKEIKVSGIGGKSSMARELAITVFNALHDKTPDVLKRSVVVLPDDSILFSFLDHCSRLGLAINPSMGFPLKNHPLLQVLHKIKSLRKQLLENSSDWFITEQAKWFKENPLLIAILNETDLIQLTALSNNLPITGRISPIAKIITNPPTTPYLEQEIINNFLFEIDSNKLSAIEGLKDVIQQESKVIWNQLIPYYSKLTISSWWKLYLGILDKIRIPFRSEKDEGVQVMGFLETRILDYEYVFIASMNEGTLPSNNTPKSLIPYSLRKAYQLPCREEQDAVTAYHFYRLLQRAEYIYFFYNSDMNEMGGGERSRFLLQLHHELKESNLGIKFQYSQIENAPITFSNDEILINKSDDILQKLKNRFVDGFTKVEFSGLSATAINEYISCSLKFYFSQIAELKEKEIHDTIDPSVFGNILHEAMQKIYGNHEIVTDKIIETSLINLEKFINDAIYIKFKKTPLSGNDFLMKGVLHDLISRILKNDLSETPFSILGLEEKFQEKIEIKNIGNVFIKGIVDRIDEKDKVIRILDYKTGKDVLNLPEDISEIFSNPEYKTTLQLLLYTLLANNKLNGKKTRAGLIKLRSINEGITYLTKDQPIENSLNENFIEYLKKLILEIFDKEVPFKQTKEIERCVFCSYKGLCNKLDN